MINNQFLKLIWAIFIFLMNYISDISNYTRHKAWPFRCITSEIFARFSNWISYYLHSFFEIWMLLKFIIQNSDILIFINKYFSHLFTPIQNIHYLNYVEL